MWDKFKAFFHKNLEDSQAFVDSYWRKIKREYQYQLKEILDWAAYLEYLQAILQEFDPVVAPNKDILIQYFRDNLRPSIWAQLNARGRKLNSWKEAIEKAVNAEAKALLQLPSSTGKIDAMCLQGYRPAKKEDKDSGKNKSVNSPHTDVPNGKHSQQSSTHQSQTGKKDQDYQEGSRRRDRRRQGRTHDSPTTDVNIIPKKEEKDISHIEWFHRRKKGHFANKCP